MAKWLLTIKPNINISACGEYAFATSCINNYFNIASWLLEVKPTINISVENEIIFRTACEDGNLNKPRLGDSPKRDG